MKFAAPQYTFAVALMLLVSTESQAQQPAAPPRDIGEVIEVAVGGSGQERYVAIDDLGERGEVPDKAVPALINMLDDSDEQVRWRSARALGDYGEDAKAAAPKLREMLNDGNPIIQYHAAATLGKLGDKSDANVDALAAQVTNRDSRVARAAIAALRNLNPDPERVLAVMNEVIASDDEAVVVYALEAAIERGAKAVPALNAALKQPRTAYLACVAIEQIGPDAAGTVPGLAELLGETKHSHLLTEALLALASIGPAAKSAAPQIMPLLEMKTDNTVPVAAAYALGSIGATDADDALKTASQGDSNPFLQMVAAWSLAKIHPDDAQLQQQALAQLQAGLKSDDPAIQAAAQKGIEKLQTSTDSQPQQ